MRHARPRIEVFDPDLPANEQVIWSGALGQFQAANADMPLTAEELAHLTQYGTVMVGGGAAAEYGIRLLLTPEEEAERSAALVGRIGMALRRWWGGDA